jgi:tetratricopeptide (TPR) repeat protein
MNSYNEALKIYGKSAGTDTSSLLYNIANVYFNCQMFDVCERYYEQAILEREAKNPLDKVLLFHAHSKLSLAQIEQRKCPQALGNLHKALKLAASSGEAVELLRQCAYVKELEGKWEEAL